MSFSANDKVGHSFGPYSQEVEDITLRTDRVLGDLFNYIDQKIGLGEHNYCVNGGPWSCAGPGALART